jgi:hypothetical protein
MCLCNAVTGNCDYGSRYEEHDGVSTTVSLGRWRKTVSPHYSGNRGRIRRARCAVHDGSHFPEKMRAEYTRSQNREHLRDGGTEIVEAVDRSARNAKHVTRSKLDSFAFYREGQHSLKTVDSLFVTNMTMCHRQLRLGRYIELEHRYGPRR